MKTHGRDVTHPDTRALQDPYYPLTGAKSPSGRTLCVGVRAAKSGDEFAIITYKLYVTGRRDRTIPATRWKFA